MSQKTTLSDIADSLGISVATVHRALTNSGRISKKTKEMIIQKAQEMNYETNMIASSLSSKKKLKFAFLCPNNFFYNEIITGAKAASDEYKILGLVTDYLLTESYSPQEQVQQLNLILEENNYDAVALSPTHTLLLNPLIESLAERHIPVVTFNNDVSNTSRNCFVGENSYISGQMAAQLYCSILPQGSKIAVMQSLVSAEGLRQRIKGFCDYVKTDKRLDILGIYDFYDNIENAYEISRQILLSTHTKGIFSNSMMGTIGTCRSIKELYTSDFPFVIGYDYNKELEGYMVQDILYGLLSQSPYLQGYYTIKLLYNLLNTPGISKLDPLYLPTQLIMKSNLQQIEESMVLQTSRWK